MTGTVELVVVQEADQGIVGERRMCGPSCLSIPLVRRVNCLVEDRVVVVASSHSYVVEAGQA